MKRLMAILSSKPIFMRVFSRKNQCHQHVRKCFTNVPTKVRPLTTFPLSYRSIVVVLLVEDFICASPSSKTHPVPSADKNLNFPEPNRFVCAISELGGIVRQGGSNVHAYCIRGVRRRWSGSFSGLTELCFLIDFYSTLTRAPPNRCSVSLWKKICPTEIIDPFRRKTSHCVCT